MAIITRAEVKTLLRLTDNYASAEDVTMSSVAYQRLDNKPNVEIIFIAADALNSTGASTRYTTADYYTTQDAGGYEIVRRIDTGTIGDTQTIYISYTYNDYDSLIDTLIPLVQDDLVEYLNNIFPDKNTLYQSATMTLNDLTPPTITDSESKFVTEGFEATMDIALEGSYRNAGIYTIATAAAGTLTLSTSDSLLGESSTDDYGGNTLRITRIKWPQSIKPLVAQIIWANINKVTSGDIKSKSIGPTSVTYMPLGSGGYSEHIIKGLGKYKKVRMSKGV